MHTRIYHQNSKRVVILLLTIVSFCYSSFAQQIGYLKIKVNETATIYLNNRNLGDYGPNEQILKEVPLGTSQIKVMKDGYETQTKNVTITVANEIKEISFLLQRPQSFQVEKDVSGSSVSVEYGELTVITKLSGSLVPAKVFVDGKFADNAPVKLSKLFVGIHTIEVDYNSFKKSRTISIEKNKKDVLEIELLTASQVTFKSDLSGVEGWLEDGKRFSIPSVQLISAGEKTLSFSSEDYFYASKKLFIDGESKYNIMINLSKDLPYVGLDEVGRVTKPLYAASDFTKPETKLVRPDKIGPYLGAIGGFIVFALLGNAVLEEPAGVLTGIGGGIAGGLLLRPKKQPVTIKENVDFNRYEVPKILREKNAEIIKYNKETERMLEEKKKQKYNDSAITVTKH